MRQNMYAMTLLLGLATAGCGGQPSASTPASNYPPDYSWGERCREDGTFRVCRSENGSSVFLTVRYSGMLKDRANLSLYVRLNGRDGVFGGFDAPSAGDRSLRIANGAYNCRSAYEPSGFSHYDCDMPTPAMKNVFFYARDAVGRMNAWDLDLAVVDGAGNWDSRFGANYRYRIEPGYQY